MKELQNGSLSGLSPDEIQTLMRQLQMFSGGTGAPDEGMMITPEPSFSVHSKVDSIDLPCPGAKIGVVQKIGLSQQVYVNVCGHEALPPMQQVKQVVNEKGETQEGLNVPVAVGPVKEEKLMNGEIVYAVDVVVHVGVIVDSDRDASGSFQHWLIELALQYIARKHGIILNHQYSIAPMKYMGKEVTPQRVRRPAGKYGIQEIAKEKSKDSKSQESAFAILSKAGVLGEEATATVPKTKSASKAPVAAIPPAAKASKKPIPMEIRVVQPEEDIRAKMAKEIASGKEEQPVEPAVPSLLVSKDNQRAIGTSQEEATFKPDEMFLKEAKTTRLLPKAPILVATFTPAIAVTTDADTQLDTTSLPCIIHKRTEASITYHIDPPKTAQSISPNDLLRLQWSLPDTDAEQMLKKGLVKLSGNGTRLTLDLPGSPLLYVRLPFPVLAISGIGENARAEKCQWDLERHLLLLELHPWINPTLAIPPSGDNKEQFLAELRRFVEVGGLGSKGTPIRPDPGSRPWLLAQALAADTAAEPEKRQPEGPKEIDKAPKDDDDTLPEDAFHAIDALSLHYLSLRKKAEEERKSKRGDQESSNALISEEIWEGGKRVGTRDVSDILKGTTNSTPTQNKSEENLLDDLL